MDYSEIYKTCDQENESFENYIQTLKEHALAQRNNFLNTEPFSLSAAVWALNYMQIYYLNNIFFPDEEIYKKFNDFGIKKSDLRWMMPIAELKAHFDDLERKGIVIYKNQFMNHLMVYLSIFTTKDVMSWTELYRATRKGPVLLHPAAQIELAVDRVRPGVKKRNYKLTKEKMMTNAIAKKIIDTEEEANLKPNTIVSMMKGNINKEFLFDWLKDSFPYSPDVLKQDKFLITILPLMKYVFRNLAIPESIEDIPDGKYARRRIDKVQLHIIKKWIFKE